MTKLLLLYSKRSFKLRCMSRCPRCLTDGWMDGWKVIYINNILVSTSKWKMNRQKAAWTDELMRMYTVFTLWTDRLGYFFYPDLFKELGI